MMIPSSFANRFFLVMPFMGLSVATQVCGRAEDPVPSVSNQPNSKEDQAPAGTARETRMMNGWTVRISCELFDTEPQLTDKALKLLDQQLAEIVRIVPKSAVIELQKVPLYLSKEYRGIPPRAEYHPSEDWLAKNGRDPAMAKGVEFTNVRIFESESQRMPNFVLHELAHAYHDRVLPQGFEHHEIAAAFARAKESQTYDAVKRHNGDGKPDTIERSYAMSNAMEYFAECSEAFFSRNDFYPFTRDELKRHDPAMFELLGKLWNESNSPAKN